MVPYHRPIPEKKTAGGMSGFLGAWVQAEKMIQIALILPCAAFIGWAAGAGLDHLLHQAWISMAGIVFGIIAGLVSAIKLTVVYSSRADGGNDGGANAGKGNSDTKS